MVIQTIFRFLLCLFAFSFAFAESKKLSIDDFIRHGDYLSISLSPDGKHIAIRVREEGRVILAVLERETGKQVGGVDPGDKNEIHSIYWASNERILLEFAEKHHYYDAPVPTGELFGVDVNGARLDILYGYRASDEKTGSRLSTRESSYASQEIIDVLEHDKKYVLIAEYPWTKYGNTWRNDRKKNPVVSKLNVRSGRKKVVERIPFPGAKVVADKNGNVRFASWIDENYDRRAAFKATPDSDWQNINSEYPLSEGFTPIALNKEVTKAYFYGSDLDSGFENIFELELKTGVVKALFNGLTADIESWTIDRATREPVLAMSYPAKVQYHYTNKNSELIDIHKKFVNAFSSQNVYIAGQTSNYNQVLVKTTGDTNPGEYLLFDKKSGRADAVLLNRSWIDPKHMRPTQPIQFTARDGLNIPGYLTLPTLEKNEKAPLVVMIHGGPHGIRDYWGFDWEVQLLANQGYAVLQINYRGSGGYGSEFKKRGYRQWGGEMIDDILDGTQWAKKRDNIDASRVCIYGASYGGYASLMAVAKSNNMYKCAIGYVGVYDLFLAFKKGTIPDLSYGESYLKIVLGTDEERLKAFSPTYLADQIQEKVMLIHGDEDDRVPVIHTKKMYKALKEAGNEPVLKRYRLSGHGVWDLDARRDLYISMLDFLSENLGVTK